MTADLHSRARLAGYDPERLASARIAVVGCGALGQNLLLDLALSGVAELAVIDPDRFEPHNATRSPLYPTPQQEERWGNMKAVVVAHRLLELMTAAQPCVRYAVDPVQQVGDAVLRWADVVCAAVDTARARAWLAERCRLASTPLVEAGFVGHHLNLSVFGPELAEPCYRCLQPGVIGAHSCRAFAAAAEAAGIVPAVQSGAAALAAVQAEQAIAWLHGDAPLRGRRLYLNARTGRSRVVELVASDRCPGVHASLSDGDATTADAHDVEGSPSAAGRGRRTDAVEGVASGGERGRADIGASTTFAQAMEEVSSRAHRARMRLPDAVVVTASCVSCGTTVAVGEPEWRWLLDARCAACSGSVDAPAATAEPKPPIVAEWLDASLAEALVSRTLYRLGAPPGAHVHLDLDGQVIDVRIPGDIDDVLGLLA